MLDDLDRRLLRHLQVDPGQSAADLAAAAGVTPATAWRRVEKLTASGVIRGQQAEIDWTALGYTVEVSLRVSLDKSEPRAFDVFTAAAREVPEVTEIQTFLGRVDVRLSVVARDMGHYQALYRERILGLPHIADIEALMHVADVKTDQVLPI